MNKLKEFFTGPDAGSLPLLIVAGVVAAIFITIVVADAIFQRSRRVRRAKRGG
jgi:hypothetical protein